MPFYARFLIECRSSLRSLKKLKKKKNVDSSKLVMFNIPLGHYRFSSYGIHRASEMFQIKIGRVNEGIKGAKNVQDDMIV